MAPLGTLLVGVSGSAGIVNLLPEIATWKGKLAEGFLCIMTPSAARLVNPLIVGGLLDCRVHRDRLGGDQQLPLHVSLAATATTMLVAPATANTIAAVALGQANNLLTLTILNFPGTVGFVPAINNEMRRKLTVQRNLRQLEDDGYRVCEPENEGGKNLAGSVQGGHSPFSLRRFALSLAELSRDRNAE